MEYTSAINDFREIFFERFSHTQNADINDTYGHGTAIYNIIRSCRDIADIYIMKLMCIENGLEEDELIEALTHISNHYKFDLIHLSLGVSICNQYNKLFLTCKKLTDAGTIMVSAFDNIQSISYPAAFPNVIGVTGSIECVKADDVIRLMDDTVNLAAKGGIQRVAWVNPEYTMLGGNSFACAHASVKIIQLMAEGCNTMNEILSQFSAAGSPQIPEPMQKRALFPIKKAVLFPFNKEMHSLIRFSDMLPFEIVNIYDSKYSPNVSRYTNEILSDESVESILIKNIKYIDWECFDCLILGHLDELATFSRDKNIKFDLIRTAIEKGKNLYSFDCLPDFLNHKHKDRLFYPYIDENDLPPYHMGKLYRYSKPIVGVMGTSSKQGKFTLQMKIRKKMLESGYQIGQIGTEPSSLLYGMDYVFPMGYHSAIHIKEYDVIRYLNYILNDLMIQENDLIIVGSQSGTVQYDNGNISQYNVGQYLFLVATMPDVVILCINPYDELEYIKRTIQFIESAIETKVISLVMFPMDLKEDWTGVWGQKQKMTKVQFNEKKVQLEQYFQCSVFHLDEERDMDLLVKEIIDFF